MIHPETVRDPAGTLALAFAAGAVATTLLAATGGTRHPGADLVAYVLPAGALGLGARWWAAPAAAVVLWLFYDGFLVGRHGVLTWHGTIDGWRLGLIVAGALGGLLIGRVSRFTAAPAPRR